VRDALDAAWGDFPTDVGLDWLRYTGAARPTSEWCADAARVARLTFVFEADSTWSQCDYATAHATCIAHEARAREVHPNVESMAVVVSDGNWLDDWDASEAGRGWADAATLPFFPYGAVPICDSFNRGAMHSPLCLRGTWVPETWGWGTLLSQVVGASPVDNTDLDHVRAPYWQIAPDAPLPATILPAGEQAMQGPRTLLVGGNVDTFQITDDGALWWHHVDKDGNGHPSVQVTVEGTHDVAWCDPNTGIDQINTVFGPFLTASRKETRPDEPPTFWQIRIVAYGYVARLL
jgi:hypothetical protein